MAGLAGFEDDPEERARYRYLDAVDPVGPAQESPYSGPSAGMRPAIPAARATDVEDSRGPYGTIVRTEKLDVQPRQGEHPPQVKEDPGPYNYEYPEEPELEEEVEPTRPWTSNLRGVVGMLIAAPGNEKYQKELEAYRGTHARNQKKIETYRRLYTKAYNREMRDQRERQLANEKAYREGVNRPNSIEEAIAQAAVAGNQQEVDRLVAIKKTIAPAPKTDRISNPWEAAASDDPAMQQLGRGSINAETGARNRTGIPRTPATTRNGRNIDPAIWKSVVDTMPAFDQNTGEPLPFDMNEAMNRYEAIEGRLRPNNAPGASGTAVARDPGKPDGPITYKGKPAMRRGGVIYVQ